MGKKELRSSKKRWKRGFENAKNTFVYDQI